MSAGYVLRGAGLASPLAPLRRLARRIARLRRSLRRRRELAELLDAEDRILADIGIARLDLTAALAPGLCHDPLPSLRRARTARLSRT